MVDAHESSDEHRSPESDFPPLGGPLDPVNEEFHRQYARARDGAELAGPVLVLLGDELTLVRPGDESASTVFPAASRVFHVVKVVAHVPVAAFSLVSRSRGDDAFDRRALERIRTNSASTLALLSSELPPGELREQCRSVIESSLAFLDGLPSAARSEADRRAFARSVGPLLMQLIEHASRDLLRVLDEAFHAALDALRPGERDALQVVVAGAHQARERSLGMQFFQRRLAEPEGTDERVTYAEAVATVEEAVRLVGTRRFDEVLADAFFGDRKRLQRDLLGDVAARVLDASEQMRTRPGA